MNEIPKSEIYSIIILPSDEEKKIGRLEKELNKEVLVNFGDIAYTGKLCKHQDNHFYIKYQTMLGIEEKNIEINSTNVIFVRTDNLYSKFPNK